VLALALFGAPVAFAQEAEVVSPGQEPATEEVESGATEDEGGGGLLSELSEEIREQLPDALLAKPFVVENWQWLGLALLVLLAVVLDRIVRWIAERVCVRLAGGEKVRLDKELLTGFERPVGMLAGALAFGFLLPVLGIQGNVETSLDVAAGFVAAIAGIWAVYRLVDLGCGFLQGKAARTDTKFDDMFIPLLRRTMKMLVVVVGLVYLASKWSQDLWGIVAGLGIGSLAVGFAARDSIENLFGTFTVLLDKPFQIGDWIIVSDLEGTVESVGFRSTRIRTFYNSLITVPNRTFISSDVDNMGRRKYRRIKTMLGLAYDTPPEKVEAFCEGVRQIIRTHPYTRKDYYHVYLNELTDSSLNVLLYCFVETPEWATELREKHRLYADILRVADELGVSFSFPTQTIHMARPEDLAHDDVPSGDLEGKRVGRRAADAVVQRSMADFGGAGAIPPPVSIERAPVKEEDGA